MAIVVSTSATTVYGGLLMPATQTAIPEVVAIDCRNMNMWEHDAARGAIEAIGRPKLILGSVEGNVRDSSNAVRLGGGV